MAPFDAQQFDARTSSFSCPNGSAAAFSREFRQIAVEECTSFSVSDDGHALARCQFANKSAIAYGLATEPLESTTLLMDPTTLSLPRISSDGMHATAMHYEQPFYTAFAFHREGTSWVQEHDVVVASGVSEISTGPPARILANDGSIVSELEQQADGSWNKISDQRFMFEFAASFAGGVHLSGDGLRAWYPSEGGEEWLDRPDRDSDFVDRGAMPGSQQLGDAALAPDCSGLYFSTLGRIWVAPRE